MDTKSEGMNYELSALDKKPESELTPLEAAVVYLYHKGGYGDDAMKAASELARLRKIEAAAWPALETYYDIEDEFSESFEVDKEYAVVPDGAGIWRLTKKAIAYRKLSTALEESE